MLKGHSAMEVDIGIQHRFVHNAFSSTYPLLEFRIEVTNTC
jgi:hypothetical protein